MGWAHRCFALSLWTFAFAAFFCYFSSPSHMACSFLGRAARRLGSGPRWVPPGYPLLAMLICCIYYKGVILSVLVWPKFSDPSSWEENSLSLSGSVVRARLCWLLWNGVIPSCLENWLSFRRQFHLRMESGLRARSMNWISIVSLTLSSLEKAGSRRTGGHHKIMFF